MQQHPSHSDVELPVYVGLLRNDDGIGQAETLEVAHASDAPPCGGGRASATIIASTGELGRLGGMPFLIRIGVDGHDGA
jgi:hypothetical protein